MADQILPSFSLKGKHVLITGGAGILGRHFCFGLAEAGANLTIVDLNAKESIDLATEVSHKYNIKAISISGDISSPDFVSKLVEQSSAELGDIHVLHNNAATKTNDLNAFLAPYEEYSLETWKDVMNVNIDAMFLMTQAVGKHMIENEISGSIIQTCSIYGIMGPDQRIYEGSNYMGSPISSPGSYSASKAAVHGLTQYLASYWGEKNIRVNSLTPGGCESGQNETFLKNYSKRIPLGRMAKQHEMVGALIYLASDASSYVNGHNLVIDGGLNSW